MMSTIFGLVLAIAASVFSLMANDNIKKLKSEYQLAYESSCEMYWRQQQATLHYYRLYHDCAGIPIDTAFVNEQERGYLRGMELLEQQKKGAE